MKSQIVPGTNHFTYAILDVEELEAGIWLDLVVGNKVDKIGDALVQLIDGMLVITFNGVSTSFEAKAFTVLPSGNIHTDFKHNNIAVIDCPEADANGYIYLYLHAENFRSYVDSDGNIIIAIAPQPVAVLPQDPEALEDPEAGGYSELQDPDEN